MNHLVDSATGELISSTILEINDVKPGHEVVTLPDGDEVGVWNPETKSFDPRPVKRISSVKDFLLRFTANERVAIRTLAKSDIIAEDFLAMLDLVDSVDLDAATLAEAMDYMVANGAITQARRDEVLNG